MEDRGVDSKILQNILPNAADSKNIVEDHIVDKDVELALKNVPIVTDQYCNFTGFELCIMLNVVNMFLFLYILYMTKCSRMGIYFGDMKSYVQKISLAQLFSSTVATITGFWLTRVVAIEEDVETEYFSFIDLRIPIGMTSIFTIFICIVRCLSYLVANSDFYMSMTSSSLPVSKTITKQRKKQAATKRSIETPAMSQMPFLEKKVQGSMNAVVLYFCYAIVISSIILLVCVKFVPQFILSPIEKLTFCIPDEILSNSYQRILVFIMFSSFNLGTVYAEKTYRVPEKTDYFGIILASPFTTTTIASTSVGWVIIMLVMYFYLEFASMQFVVMWEIFALFDALWMLILSVCLVSSNKSLHITSKKVIGIP